MYFYYIDINVYFNICLSVKIIGIISALVIFQHHSNFTFIIFKRQFFVQNVYS